MEDLFSPKHSTQLSDSWVLWFEASNRYLVISNELWIIMTQYFECTTEKDFVSHLQDKLQLPPEKAELYLYYKEITELLVNSNEKVEPELKNPKPPPLPIDGTVESYRFGNIVITIHYGSERLKTLIHPQWAHASTTPTDVVTSHFQMFKDEAHLYLYKDHLLIGHYPVAEYHLLQGQFALQLLNVLYEKNESDWIATFHASTVCNDKEAIMIIGDSGNGKSTLSTVLMAHGFDVLADDFTPLSAKNREVYRFPSGISVKEGAFKILEDKISDFGQLPLHMSPSKQVKMKYIPPPHRFETSIAHLPCSKIVYVKYDAKQQSEFKKIDPIEVLPTLITESWVSPLASNAQLFLNWLKEVHCYELNYSDNNFAVSEFQKLFNGK